jgi:hypothetical protein
MKGSTRLPDAWIGLGFFNRKLFNTIMIVSRINLLNHNLQLKYIFTNAYFKHEILPLIKHKN